MGRRPLTRDGFTRSPEYPHSVLVRTPRTRFRQGFILVPFAALSFFGLPSVTASVTAPTTTITDGPSDPTVETAATLSFSADEEAVTFSCSLDGGPAEPCSSPATYSGLTETGHTFSVSATNTEGSPGNPATWTWTIIPPDQPNILLIVTDDQSTTTFNRPLMPTLFGELVDKGVLFDRAYVNTSLCCPSRANILTGLFQHHTGVDANGKALDRPTFVEALHDLGYRTMLGGKYLNSWPCDPRPEFDRWVCEAQQGYEDPVLNVDGVDTPFSGYTSDILAGEVSTFITGTPAGQPFFALFGPKNPHLPANDDRCSDLPVDPYRPPSFDEDTENSGKPMHVRRPPLTPEEVQKITTHHLRMTQAVACLDPAIGTVLSSLGEREGSTFVVYVSDNGYLYGEHRLDGKVYPYEESVRVPFVVRYPRLVPATDAFASSALVQNVDIAATIAELAGFPWGADGQSFLPLMTKESTATRDGALIQHCVVQPLPCTNLPTFNGIVTQDYKYLEHATGERELYDLAADQWELWNRAGDPAFEETEATLASELAQLTAPPAPETTIVSGPHGTLPPNPIVTFRYFSQSRFATYECRLDRDGVDGVWERCDGQSVTLGPLEGGSYVFYVRGIDENETTDPSPSARLFSVIEGGGPTTTITSGPSDPTMETSATFTFSADEDPVTFDCSLDGGAAQACTSPFTYTGLSAGPHTFSVVATDDSGNAGNTATWSWTIEDAVTVSVQDYSFSPKSPLAPRGGTVRWNFDGPSDHTASDNSGMGLFDSGPTGPGGDFRFTFVGAGKYTYGCTIHPLMTASIRVPIEASPPTGSTSTTFDITWASQEAPLGYLYDVQIRRPGSGAWGRWMSGQTIAASSFAPDAGPGLYGFRARLRSETNGAFSRYSPAAVISVTS